MLKIHSLTRQTVGIVLVAQVLCAVTLSTAVIFHEAHTHLRTFDVRLQGHSDSLLGSIQDAEDADSSVQVDPSELRLPEEDVFAVYDQGGKLLGNSPIAPAELITKSQDGFRNVQFHGVRYRILQREALRVIDRAEFGKSGLKRPVTILYASPETRVWHEIFESVRFSLLAIFLAAGITVAFVSFLLRRALRPLSDLAAAAGQISPPLLEFQPPASVLQIRELRPLSEVLSKAVQRLREAFEKEQRFVGDAAHELKTAIAVVRSSIQVLMLKRRTADEYAAGLERVLDDNVRVEGLVAQMLLLARLEEGSNSGVGGIDLGIAAQAVVTKLQPLAQEQHLAFHLDCAPAMIVRLSQERAQVLISNIVLNAIQHSQCGAAVAVRVYRQGKAAIALEVTDSGSGIGEDALPHIFDRFYREDGSRSRNTGGTGLGLAICKSIADGAGATIQVASRPGAGTAVTVIFSVA
jgi:signal transduction histidine kinase